MFGSTKALIAEQKARVEDLKSQITNHELLYARRINDLQSQIKDLKKLVFSTTSSTAITATQLEQGAIIDGREEVIELSEEEIAELEAIESEATKILSGTY